MDPARYAVRQTEAARNKMALEWMLWVAIGINGSEASEIARYQTREECLAAEKALGKTITEANGGKPIMMLIDCDPVEKKS